MKIELKVSLDLKNIEMPPEELVRQIEAGISNFVQDELEYPDCNSDVAPSFSLKVEHTLGN